MTAPRSPRDLERGLNANLHHRDSEESRCSNYATISLGCLGTVTLATLAGFAGWIFGYLKHPQPYNFNLYIPPDCYPYQTVDYLHVANTGTAFKYPVPLGVTCGYSGPYENYSFYTFHTQDNETNRVLYVAEILGENEAHARKRAVRYLEADYPIRFYPLTLVSGSFCFNELGSFAPCDENFIDGCETPSAFSLPTGEKAWGLVPLHNNPSALYGNRNHKQNNNKNIKLAEAHEISDVDMANSPFAQSNVARRMRGLGSNN